MPTSEKALFSGYRVFGDNGESLIETPAPQAVLIEFPDDLRAPSDTASAVFSRGDLVLEQLEQDGVGTDFTSFSFAGYSGFSARLLASDPSGVSFSGQANSPRLSLTETPGLLQAAVELDTLDETPAPLLAQRSAGDVTVLSFSDQFGLFFENGTAFGPFGDEFAILDRQGSFDVDKNLGIATLTGSLDFDLFAGFSYDFSFSTGAVNVDYDVRLATDFYEVVGNNLILDYRTIEFGGSTLEVLPPNFTAIAELKLDFDVSTSGLEIDFPGTERFDITLVGDEDVEAGADGKILDFDAGFTFIDVNLAEGRVSSSLFGDLGTDSDGVLFSSSEAGIGNGNLGDITLRLPTLPDGVSTNNAGDGILPTAQFQDAGSKFFDGTIDLDYIAQVALLTGGAGFANIFSSAAPPDLLEFSKILDSDLDGFLEQDEPYLGPGSVNDTKDRVGIKLELKLFDLELTATAKLVQTVDFAPTGFVTTFLTDEGNSYQTTLSAGETGAVNIAPDLNDGGVVGDLFVGLQGDYTVKTSLVLDFGISLDLLKGSIEGFASVPLLGDFELDAEFGVSLPDLSLFSIPLVTLFEDTRQVIVSTDETFQVIASQTPPPDPGPTNRTPVFLTGRTHSVDENETFVTQLSAIDDDGDPLDFDIVAGQDGLLFDVTSDGQLTFKDPQDFERRNDFDGDNVFKVTVQVSDGTDSDTRALEISLQDVDETPPPAPDPGTPNQAPRFEGQTQFFVPEDTVQAGTVIARDPEGGAVSYALIGGADRGLFKINPATGVLSFLSAPDFENQRDANSDNRYEVTVRASDGLLTETQDVIIVVEDDGILPPPAPSENSIDLSVEIGTPSTANPVPGTPFKIPFRIKNSSPDQDAGASTATIYLSDDRTISEDDEILRVVDISEVLAGRNQGRIPFVGIDPDTEASGKQFLIIQADTQNAVDEVDEANNTAVVSIFLPDEAPPASSTPDFVVSGLRLGDEDLIRGTNVFVAYQVSNVSPDNNDQSGAIVSFFFSPSDGGPDILVGNDVEHSDRLGERQVYLPVPETLAPGEYSLVARVNSDGSVPEDNPGNNADTVVVDVLAAVPPPPVEPADFRISDLSISDTKPASGDIVRVGFDIQNVGAGDGAFGPVVGVFLSDDEIITTGDRLLEQTAFTTITSGGSVSSFVDVSLPFGLAPGDYFVGLFADPTELEAEEKENNNTRSVKVTIPDTALPDLQFTAFSPVSNVFEPGGEVTVFYTITNNGNASVEAGQASVFLALSTDATFSTDDIPLTADGGLPEILAPGASISRELTFTLNEPLDPGLFHLVAATDAAGIVDEIFDSNNEASFQFEVLPPDVVGGLSPTQDVIIAQGEITNLTKVQTAPLTGGGFVVAWADQTSGVQGDVFARLFDEDGNALGSSIRLNSFLNGVQQAPIVAGLNNGSWVAVWESIGQDGSEHGVFAQRFSDSGVKQGSEFRVNTVTSGRQRAEDVETLSNGNFLVVYKTPDGSSNADLKGRIYTESGSLFGSEFTVNSSIGRDNTNADIAALANGGFVVTWRGLNPGASEREVFMQRFNGFGLKVGGEVIVRSDTDASTSVPEVATLTDGSFVVAWSELHDEPSGRVFQVEFRRFDANGNALDSDTFVSSASSLGAVEADALPDGGFVITWRESVDGTLEVLRQAFDADGTSRGDAEVLTVNTTATNGGADIAVGSNGDQLYVWEAAGEDIGARLISESGAGDTTSFAVFAATPETQTEGDFGPTSVIFRVARSGNDLDRVDTIDWSVSTGAGLLQANDYLGGQVPRGSVTFAAGETEKFVEIFLQGDYLKEDSEILRIFLSNAPADSRIDQFRAEITVVNDDDGRDLLVENLPSAIDLSASGGVQSYVIVGISDDDNAGRALDIAQDINGDGLDDILIGAESAQRGGFSSSGEAYAVFGDAVVPTSDVSLGSLGSGDGITIIAQSPNSTQLLGASVAGLGDVNGDGLADVGFAAPGDDIGAERGAGSAGIVFGSASGLGTSQTLETLSGGNGRYVTGVTEDDFTFRVLASAGDINGDGFDDVLATAPSRAVDLLNDAGEVYVLFGAASPNWTNTGALNGTNGFRINGANAGDKIGLAASGGFDFNGDGFDDILIGSRDADPNGVTNAGEAYVIFGQASGFGTSFDLGTLDGTNGFQLSGAQAFADAGFAVAALGDLNGDGFDELAISSPSFDADGGTQHGEISILFGSDVAPQPDSLLPELSEPGLARLTGFAGSQAGRTIVDAGDVDGDGLADFLIRGASSGTEQTGPYLIFGHDGFSGFDLSELDGTNGIALTGISNVVEIGAGGDVNGDGFDDILISQQAAGQDRIHVILGDPSLRSGFQIVGDGVVTAFEGSTDVASYALSTPFQDTSFSLVGPDAGLFDIVTTPTGVEVAFKSAPSLAAPDGAALDDLYNVTLVATSGAFQDSLPVKIRVEVNEVAALPPTFVGASDFSFDEGTPLAHSINAQAFGGRDLGFAITGGADAADFEIDSVTGLLSFVGQPDFEAPVDQDLDNAYEVIVRIDDGLSTADRSFTFTILDVEDSFEGTEGADEIIGSPVNDVIIGLDGPDRIEARAGDDSVDAGGGDDIVIGGSGAGDDSYEGGDGVDTIVYSSAISGITVDLSSGNEAASGPDIDTDVVTGFENIVGGAGDDTLTGSASDNAISGGTGNDTLDGGAGADALDGEDGRDTVSYAASTERVTVFLGISASGGDAEGDVLTSVENLMGSAHDDILVGDVQANEIHGGLGRDILAGGAGADHLVGGDGDDVFSGGLGADTVDGGAGALDISSYADADAGIVVDLAGGTSAGAITEDILIGIEGFQGARDFENTFIGDTSEDLFLGGFQSDTMTGGAGRDILASDRGDDTLDGGVGADVFVAGDGIDVLRGGGADGLRDVFVFERDHGTNTIEDFQIDEDVILFQRTGATQDVLVFTQNAEGIEVSLSIGTTTVQIDGVTLADITSDDDANGAFDHIVFV